MVGDEKLSHRAVKRHQADLRSVLALTLGIPLAFMSTNLLIYKVEITRNLPRIEDRVSWKELRESYRNWE